MSKKSTLDRIEIPKPCFADWERMVGSQNIRFCTECNKHVYNLSGMTRGEAEALVASAPKGRLCARLTRGADGTTLTADDQPSVQLIWRRASPIANVVVSAMLTMSTPGIASAAGINSDRSSIASVFDAPDPEAAPQGAVAALSGSTTDKQGHAIRGAKLMLINEDTGDTQTAVSSYDGTFRFFVLTNGLFTLSVEGAGLYKVEANGLNLGNGQEQRLDITMETIPDQVTLGGIMARPMNPLRKLYAESDLVVVARAGDSVKIKNDGESRFVRTSLSVSSTLKGEGSDPVVYVYQSVYGDEPGPFTRGEDLLIFLEHNRNGGAIKPIGGYELVDFQRSVKELSSSALDVYAQRINELAQLSQEEKPNQEELVEWLVRCAENPATRWEGAFELAMSAWELRAKCTQDDADADSEESDSSEETFEDGSADPAQKESTVEPVTEAQDLGARASLAALLTADQKERLMTALLDTEQITEGDEQLIELVKDFHDPRLIPFLVSRLRRTENNPPHSANTIVQVVAELLKDNRISALAESYDDAPYDYEDDENEERGDNKASTQSAAVRERSAQIRLFLQQVERKIRK